MARPRRRRWVRSWIAHDVISRRRSRAGAPRARRSSSHQRRPPDVHQPPRVACAIALAALLASVASAQDAADPRAVQPERPTVATHAGTVAPAFLEIETGIQ